MSDTLPNLNLPVMLPSQAQKHVTHNEALSILDALVQLSVLSDTTDTPPASPDEGARYLVPIGGQSAWAGQDGRIAVFQQNAWVFHTPQTGWRCYVADKNALILFDGSDWREIGGSQLENLTALGIGMDTSSAPFSATLNSALWTALYAADGGTGSMSQTINRETTADDTGLIFQTGFMTRALAGLFGSDDLRFAVSQDGTSFFDGLVIDGATGIVSQPNLPRFSGATNYDNYGAADSWTKIAINDLAYNDQGTFNASSNVFTAPTDGLYHFGGHLLFKIDSSALARMTIRMVKNGTDQVPGSFGRITGDHQDGYTFVKSQAVTPLLSGDTIELQGMFADHSAFFQADETTFWGYKVG